MLCRLLERAHAANQGAALEVWRRVAGGDQGEFARERDRVFQRVLLDAGRFPGAQSLENWKIPTIREFQRGLGESGVDLMAYGEPPKTLFVQVRVLVDYGEFETSDGAPVVLQKNSIHSLLRQDCDMLIRQGVLEIMH